MRPEVEAAVRRRPGDPEQPGLRQRGESVTDRCPAAVDVLGSREQHRIGDRSGPIEGGGRCGFGPHVAQSPIPDTAQHRSPPAGTVRATANEQVFPPGFFDRVDESPDSLFYAPDRLVTHIDDAAIAAVGVLCDELSLTGEVLDICSSWISHFPTTPRRLVAMGMNEAELRANEMASTWIVKDLNTDPVLPFDDGSFDAVTCCVSIDYLTRPLDVLAEVARVLRPGAPFVVTFSNRCFPTKAIRGWLSTDGEGHCAIVATRPAIGISVTSVPESGTQLTGSLNARRQERCVGSFGTSQLMKSVGLRVWMYTRPGPVSLTTRPSPPNTVDFQLPAFCTS